MKNSLLFLYTALCLSAGCDDIIDPNISKDKVHIIAPCNQAVLPDGRVIFRWEALEDADGYLFTIVSPSFEQASRIVIDTMIFADSVAMHYGCALTLDSGDYQWGIEAFNFAYRTKQQIYDLAVYKQNQE